VLIETSGLADLAPVLQAFLSEPTLEGLYRVTAVIATVDAVNGDGTLSEHSVSVRQVTLADQLLITKLDLLPPGEREARHGALRERLRRLNRSARIGATDDAQLDVLQLLRQPLADAGSDAQATRDWIDTAIAEVHGEHVHDDSIASFSLIREAPVPREALQLLLSSLEKHLGPSLLRVKGLVSVAEEPDQPAVIQGAQHLLHNLTWLSRWPDADHRTRIVFITQGIAPGELAELVNLLDRVAQCTANARLRASGQQALGAT
jgi:G3E family GTPase